MSPMVNYQLPFKQEGDKIILTGPVFLSCGCGNVTAKWASVAQNLSTRIPQGKPKSSKIIANWLTQEGLRKQYELLTKHQFGVVIAETDKGFEMINIMGGAAPKVAEQVGQLIRRHKEWKQSQSLNN